MSGDSLSLVPPYRGVTKATPQNSRERQGRHKSDTEATPKKWNNSF